MIGQKEKDMYNDVKKTRGKDGNIKYLIVLRVKQISATKTEQEKQILVIS